MSELKATEKAATAAVTALFVVILSGVASLLSAWPVMLGFGILHSHWPGVPAFGYLAVVVVLWAFRIVTPYTTKIETKGKA